MGKRSCASPRHARELRTGSSSQQLPGRRVARLLGVPVPRVSSNVPEGSPPVLLG